MAGPDGRLIRSAEFRPGTKLRLDVETCRLAGGGVGQGGGVAEADVGGWRNGGAGRSQYWSSRFSRGKRQDEIVFRPKHLSARIFFQKTANPGHGPVTWNKDGSPG